MELCIEPAALDLEHLAAMTRGDRGVMKQILEMLIADTGEKLLLLGAACQTGNTEDCLGLAHYLKSACAAVGAAGMASVLRELEQCARLRDSAGCHGAFARLAQEMDRLCAAAARV